MISKYFASFMTDAETLAATFMLAAAAEEEHADGDTPNSRRVRNKERPSRVTYQQTHVKRKYMCLSSPIEICQPQATAGNPRIRP